MSIIWSTYRPENIMLCGALFVNIRHEIMKEKIREFFKFKWMLVSSRPQHFVVVFIIGVLLGIEAVFAASATAEFKDWMWNGYKGGTWGWIKGNGFDWYDFLASMIGGLVGYGLRISCC